MANSKQWIIPKIEVWDTTQGDIGAEQVFMSNNAQTFDGLADAVSQFAATVAAQFNGQRPPELSPDAILRRVQSYRVQLTNSGGNTMFRVRFSHGDNTYIAMSPIRTATPQEVMQADIPAEPTEEDNARAVHRAAMDKLRNGLK